MRVNTAAAAGLASLAAAAAFPSAAFIPPSISVSVVSADAEAESVNEGFVKVLDGGAFLWGDPSVGRYRIAECLEKPRAEACVRAVLRQAGVDKRSPPVAVLVSPAGAGRYAWTCVGAGEDAAARPAVTIDVKAGLFAATAEQRLKWRLQAVDCILDAAAEADGVISKSRLDAAGAR